MAEVYYYDEYEKFVIEGNWPPKCTGIYGKIKVIPRPFWWRLKRLFKTNN